MSLANFNRLYAPTYFSLQDQARQHQQLEQQNQVVIYPYTRRAIPFRPSRKGKGRAIHDAEFEQERAWLLEELTKDVLAVAENANEEYEDCGDGIECGCCFSAYPFVSPPFNICCVSFQTKTFL
jgi:TRIAD3 protein (E3 ubiquitin-protein ligase RNF216)